MVDIDHLSTEYQHSDPKLTEKLHTILRFLQSQRINSINREDKTRAKRIVPEILLIESDLMQYKWLKVDAATIHLRKIAR